MVTIDAVTTDAVNSIYLIVGSDASCKTVVDSIPASEIKADTLEFNISSPSASNYYKLVFDCKEKANGTVTVSKVVYYTPDTSGDTATTLSFGTLDTKTLAVNETFTTPTPTLTAGEETLTGKTITYSCSDASVATVDESTGEVTAVANGTATITAFYEGDTTYKSASASYSIVVAAFTIAEMKSYIPSTATSSAKAKSFFLNLTDAVVTYKTGNNAYLQDTSGAILVYIKDNPLDKGKKINGIVNVTAFKYNGLAEITSWDASGADVKDNATIPDAKVVTLEELNSNFDAYESMRVKVESATVESAFSNQNATINQDGGTPFTVRDAGNSSLKMTEGNLVTIIGFPAIYSTSSSTSYQLNVWSQNDITDLGKDTRKDPNLSFPADEYSVGLSETFTAPTLSAPEGVTVGYTSSNTAVAKVDAATGAVTIVGNGITTITATSEKNSEYVIGETSYTLYVIDPNITEASFDFKKPANYGYDAPATSEDMTIIGEGGTIVSGIVTITNVKGGTSTTTRFYNSNGTIDFRIYKGAQISISAPEDYVITGISSDVDLSSNLTWDSGTATSSAWTGTANSVTLTATGTTKFSEMTVTYSKIEKVEEVTLDEDKDYVPEVVIYANVVTFNRTFVEGWNGLVLPFDMTIEDAKSIFNASAVKSFSGISVSDNGTTLMFEDATSIKAAVPFMIKIATAPTSNTYTINEVFLPTTAVNSDSTRPSYSDGDVTYTFDGTYATTGESTLEGINFTLIQGTHFYNYDESDIVKVKAFRAYFVNDSEEGEELTPAESKVCGFNFGDDDSTTDITEVKGAESKQSDKIYDLQGRMVTHPVKGIYIKNGKKVIVK